MTPVELDDPRGPILREGLSSRISRVTTEASGSTYVRARLGDGPGDSSPWEVVLSHLDAQDDPLFCRTAVSVILTPDEADDLAVELLRLSRIARKKATPT